MSENNPTPAPPLPGMEEEFNQNNLQGQAEQRSPAEKLWNQLVHLGLGEASLRIGTGVLTIILVLAVVWVMSKFYLKNQSVENVLVTPASTQAVALALPKAEELQPVLYSGFGINRQALLHTNQHAKPRRCGSDRGAFDPVEMTAQGDRRQRGRCLRGAVVLD